MAVPRFFIEVIYFGVILKLKALRISVKSADREQAEGRKEGGQEAGRNKGDDNLKVEKEAVEERFYNYDKLKTERRWRKQE